jgi:hypothetical protein
MDHGVIVRGQLHGRRIDLDEAVEARDGEVEVTVRPVAGPRPTASDMLALLATLSAGARTKSDIDRQVAEDRTSWDRD